MTLAQRLRAARESAGLTLAQVGAACGVSRQYVHRLESGVHVPSAELLRLLCAALRVSADELLELPRRKPVR